MRAWFVNGERLGSFQYMAPEQVLGGPVDRRTDLYAVGCLIHEMLTGRPVFEHESPLMVPSLHTEATPEPLRALRPDVPEDVESLVLELLAKNRATAPHTRARCTGVSPRTCPPPEIRREPWCPGPRRIRAGRSDFPWLRMRGPSASGPGRRTGRDSGLSTARSFPILPCG